MREHLFRGKRNKSCTETEWVFGFLEYYSKDNAVIFYDDGVKINHYSVDPETVGEFTEIYDSNRIRIFEGDILKAKNGHIGWVEFRKGCYVKVCNCHTNVFDIYSDNSEVIGNIYDNPELLEKCL